MALALEVVAKGSSKAEEESSWDLRKVLVALGGFEFQEAVRTMGGLADAPTMEQN